LAQAGSSLSEAMLARIEEIVFFKEFDQLITNNLFQDLD
jgi:hypothetical protein